MRRELVILAVLACGLAGGLVPWAAANAQTPDPASVQAPIKGSDATDGKGRSGPDGWSWAPQTRDQAPTGTDKHQADANSKGSGGTAPLKPGEDPGTPTSVSNAGPASKDVAAKKP